MKPALGSRLNLVLLMTLAVVFCLNTLLSSPHPLSQKSPRQVWYTLDNGMDFGSLPLPSFPPESDQKF